MSGSKRSRFLLDTNVVLYLLGGQLANPLPNGEYFISIITEIELLSYPNLRAEEEAQIFEFLQALTIIGIESDIKALAIDLRRQIRLKLPDALIIATAKALDAVLITNDESLLKITEIRVQSISILCIGAERDTVISWAISAR